MKKFILAISLILVFIFTACGDNNEDETSSYETISIDDSKEEQLNLTDYNLNYVADTDFQSYFAWSYMTESEDGYYYWGMYEGNTLLMFLDKTSGSNVPLCNRPDCEHNTEDCNAYFNYVIGDDTNTYRSDYLQFYDGNLYLNGFDEEGYNCIYKVAADGSSRDKIMKLYKSDVAANAIEGEAGSCSYPYICIHRGYVYYIDLDEDTPALRRMKLGQDQEEIVFQTSGERPNIYRLEAYGDYVFFQAGNFTDDTYMEMNGGIWAFNIETEQLQMIKENAISSYSIAGDILYYSESDGIKSYDLKKHENNTVIKSEGYLEFYADTNYIYVWNSSNALDVYSLSGDLMNTISDDCINTFCFGNSDYVFSMGVQTLKGGNCPVHGKISVSDIGIATDWEYFY